MIRSGGDRGLGGGSDCWEEAGLRGFVSVGS